MKVRNCVRATAIAMIAFPEPITTVVGLALLSATFALPGEKRAERFANMNELIKKSFRNSEPPKVLRYFQLRQPVVYHELKSILPYRDKIASSDQKHSRKLNQNILQKFQRGTPDNTSSAINCHRAAVHISTSPQHNNWFDNHKVSETVLHHTLKTSLPQYEAVSTRHFPGVQVSGVGKMPSRRIEQHKLKREWPLIDVG